jgi:hypothetical protein
MVIPNTSEQEILELGGEPLEESGFENEKPSPAFQPYGQAAEEGSAQ